MFAVLAIVETATIYVLYPDKEKFKNGLEARWFDIMNNEKEWKIIHNFQETVSTIATGGKKEKNRQMNRFYFCLRKHKCCGWNSYDDWEMNNLIGKVPGSCCRKQWHETCTNENDLENTIGCKMTVDEYLRNILTYLPYIIPLVFLFEVGQKYARQYSYCIDVLIFSRIRSQIILIVALFWNIVAHSNDDDENDYLIKLSSSTGEHRLATLIDGVRYEESANTHIQMEKFSSAGCSGESSPQIEINLFDESAL